MGVADNRGVEDGEKDDEGARLLSAVDGSRGFRVVCATTEVIAITVGLMKAMVFPAGFTNGVPGIVL